MGTNYLPLFFGQFVQLLSGLIKFPLLAALSELFFVTIFEFPLVVFQFGCLRRHIKTATFHGWEQDHVGFPDILGVKGRHFLLHGCCESALFLALQS